MNIITNYPDLFISKDRTNCILYEQNRLKQTEYRIIYVPVSSQESGVRSSIVVVGLCVHFYFYKTICWKLWWEVVPYAIITYLLISF